MSSEKPRKVNSSSDTADKIDVLDIRGTASNTMSWLQQYIREISKAPVAKQAAVGGISGWVVGYLSMKIGKAAATVVGGSLIVMQLAAHQGYIKVDWKKVNNDLEKNAKKLSKEVESRIKPGLADEVSFSRQFDKTINKAVRRLESLESEADNWFNKKLRSGRKFYQKYILGNSSEITVEDLYALHIYILAFATCTMMGRAFGRIF
ncbi:FUN14 domain-containing protein 1 [Armadillidium nasatum]|uniref:FUN14 domain-containing protein 1 n=1 Tax=Armadillidium nasatum TaxID=96803 RepID=A0A5N5SLQ4_9CRUS|nr:FUN14 domain-containing protein 1 [Armadillidium nasatum]